MVVDKRWGDGNNFTYTPEIKDILDGLLLGDGNLIKTSSLSAQFQLSQKSDHLDWIQLIIKQFMDAGIKTSTAIIDAHTRTTSAGKIINAKEALFLRSLQYRTLLPLFERWYIKKEKNIKVLPKDLNISSPWLLAHWYMGDGSCSADNYLHINLHTNSFTDDEVNILQMQFETILGIKSYVSHWRQQPILALQHFEAEKFLNLVKDYIVPSFKYKLMANPWVPPVCKICQIYLDKNSRRYEYCDRCRQEVRKNQKKLAGIKWRAKQKEIKSQQSK